MARPRRDGTPSRKPDRRTFTDAYVNLLFVPPGAPYAVPYDLKEARRLDRHLWPVPRRFSVRRSSS